MVQQHIGGAGRIDAKPGADDTASGQMRLDDPAFKEFLQEFADRGRVETQRVGPVRPIGNLRGYLKGIATSFVRDGDRA